MQRRKRWLSIILMLTAFISVLFCTGMNVCAEAVTDGISVSVSSDKAEYDSDDEVNLEITVKNTNDFEVSNLRIENILPDGVKLVSGNAVEENVTLKADDEKIVKISVAKDEGNSGTTSSTSSTPKTGESGIITILLAVLLIAGAIIVFVLKGKKGCKFFSIVLCLCLIGQLAPITLVNAQNSTSEDSLSSLTAECTYTIDGAEYLHKVVVSYDNVDVYSEVTIELQELLTNDTFINGSVEDRKEIVEELLDKLESENLIKNGSVKYNSQRECFYFNYLDGGEGSVMLSGYSDNKENSEAEYFIDPNTGFWVNLETEGLSNTNTDIEYMPSGDDKSIGYIYKYLENQNLTYSQKTAIIIDELNIEKERENLNNFKETWSSNGLKTVVKSNVTGEEFKTILNGENGHGGYDFINIRAHGYVDSNNPTVVLHETWSFINSGKYSDDIKNKRIGIILCKYGLCYYLKPSFFEYYYSGKLTGAIVVLGCCEGYINDRLVSTLANNCGAKSVIAPTDTTYTWYNTVMTDTLVHQLLLGSTIEEALNKNKLSLGKDDEEFIVKMGYTPENTPAEWKIYNGGNETLVELERLNNNGTLFGTVTDENGNPVKGAEIGIYNIRGQSFETTAITDDNGKYTLECLADSYKITAYANGYITFESDEFIDVVYGEETTYNITLKKDSEEVPQLPAIVQTVYKNEKMWLDNINSLAEEYSDVQFGYNECWFQDLDMDGTPEFIVGGMGIGFTDMLSHVYHIYKYADGELKRVKINDSVGYEGSYGKDEYLFEICWGRFELEYGSKAFKQSQMFQNKNTGKFLHTLMEKMDYTLEQGGIISFSSYNMNGTELRPDNIDIIRCGIDGNGLITDSADEDTIIKIYDDFFADLTPYKTTIKAVPCSDTSMDMSDNYDRMTDEEKKQALLHSYNVWSYEVDTDAELPLESYIDKLRETSNDEDETEVIIEIATLTDNDINPEWSYVKSLNFDYPVFKTNNSGLQTFLDESVTNEILGYMETDSDYDVHINGSFDYYDSIKGYVSIFGHAGNWPEGGIGQHYSAYTFFIDLKSRRIMPLYELFEETDGEISIEISDKVDRYIGDVRAGLLNQDIISEYDYSKCKFALNEENLTIIFSPYEIAMGAAGIIEVEIPWSDINLTCVIPEINTMK